MLAAQSLKRLLGILQLPLSLSFHGRLFGILCLLFSVSFPCSSFRHWECQLQALAVKTSGTGSEDHSLGVRLQSLGVTADTECDFDFSHWE